MTWFAVIGLVGLLVIADKKRLWAYYAVAMMAIVVTVQRNEPATDYSPYYALSKIPTPAEPGFAVIANGSLHQRALNVEGPPPRMMVRTRLPVQDITYLSNR